MVELRSRRRSCLNLLRAPTSLCFWNSQPGIADVRIAMIPKKLVLELAKGFRGRSKNCISIARERVEKALQYAYRSVNRIDPCVAYSPAYCMFYYVNMYP
jgi:hypothetical protein